MGIGIHKPREKVGTFVRGWFAYKTFIYDLGEIGPGGGIIVKVPTVRDRLAGQRYYIEVAPQGWYGTEEDPRTTWGCYGTVLGSGANGAAIQDSLNNTQYISDNCATAGIAAKLALAYQGQGKTDWCLPSQIAALYAFNGGTSAEYLNSTFSPIIGAVNSRLGLINTGQVATGAYWNSTELLSTPPGTLAGVNFPRYQPTTQAFEAYPWPKDNEAYVRPIRFFLD
jgi:hypothetical protein